MANGVVDIVQYVSTSERAPFTFAIRTTSSEKPMFCCLFVPRRIVGIISLRYCTCGPAFPSPGTSRIYVLRNISFLLPLSFVSLGFCSLICCNTVSLYQVSTSCWILRPKCNGFDPTAFRYYCFTTSFLSHVMLCVSFGDISPRYCIIALHRGECKYIAVYGFGDWAVRLEAALTS